MVFIHSSDEMYGADRMLLEIVAAAGDDVEVWLPTDLPHSAVPLCRELERRGVLTRHLSLPVIRRAYLTPKGVLGMLRRMGGLLRTLRRSHPAAVYCTTSAVLAAAPLARLAGIPRVLLHVQEIWSRSDRAALGILARTCHRVVAISDAAAASLPAGVRRRTRVVPNATPEPRQIVPLDGRAGRLTYLVASRWNGWKGHRTVLTAWDMAGGPGRLLVLGGPPASGARVDVPGIVRSLTHARSVQIVGEVPDPSSFIDQADVVVMPSDQPEPFGLIAIEAFARGRPVIGSAAGGLMDIITEGRDGWLFAPGDVRALADILTRLTRLQVSAAAIVARQTYLERYTVQQFASSWRAAAWCNRSSE